MLGTEYIKSLEDRINSLIASARIKYQDLKKESENIESHYQFNRHIDYLGELIDQILYYKKQLARIKNKDTIQEYPLEPMTDLEESELRHKKLLADKEIVEGQIRIARSAIKELENDTLLHRLINRLEMEIFRSTTELTNINSSLRIYENNPDLTDGEIDIYVSGNEEELPFQCYIYLHGTGIEIGEISYRGPDNNKWLGDIGYTIRLPYHGHNYAYKALNLIAPIILKKGVEKVIITTYENNTASKRTIEKFGGILKEIILEDVLVFECDLLKILEDKPETVMKR